MGWPMAMRMARWLGRSHRALGDSGGGGVLGYCAHYVRYAGAKRPFRAI